MDDCRKSKWKYKLPSCNFTLKMENELKSEKHFKAEEYKRNPTLCEFPHN